MIILHICIANDPRKTPIDLGIKRSKSNMEIEKGQGQIWNLNLTLLRTITCRHTRMILHTFVGHDPWWTSVVFGSKG